MLNTQIGAKQTNTTNIIRNLSSFKIAFLG